MARDGKNLLDRRRDICLTLRFKIVNHVVNVPPEGILIPMKGGTRKDQVNNTFMHIVSNKYSFSPLTILEWNKRSSTIINAPSIETFKDMLKVMPPTRA